MLYYHLLLKDLQVNVSQGKAAVRSDRFWTGHALPSCIATAPKPSLAARLEGSCTRRRCDLEWVAMGRPGTTVVWFRFPRCSKPYADDVFPNILQECNGDLPLRRVASNFACIEGTSGPAHTTQHVVVKTLQDTENFGKVQERPMLYDDFTSCSTVSPSLPLEVLKYVQS